MNGRGYTGLGLNGDIAEEATFSERRRNLSDRQVLNATAQSRRCIQRILVPVDFSVSSLEGARYASEIAKNQPAEIILLHVIALKCNWPPSGPVNVFQLRQEIRAEAERKMQTVAEIMGTRGVSAQQEIKEGVPWKTISAQAKEHGVALIVLGRHAPKTFWSALHRHTARRVVESAPCPVLTLPQGQMTTQ